MSFGEVLQYCEEQDEFGTGGRTAVVDTLLFGSIVALLSVEGIFFLPNQVRDKAERTISKFKSAEGDHATYLNAFRQFKVGGEPPLQKGVS